MAKQPKKTVKTTKTAKSTKTAKVAAPKQANAATKPAKAKAPKVVAKTPAKASKTPAKTTKAPAKATKTAAPKPQKKTPVAAKPTKTKPAPKVAKTTKTKTAKPLGRLDNPVPEGVPAIPSITSPLANAHVPAGAALTVTGSTNRGDFGYIVTLTDVTPPGPPPAGVSFTIAAPAGSPCSTTIPGANLAAGRNYQLQLSVDPASGPTPPNGQSVIAVNT